MKRKAQVTMTRNIILSVLLLILLIIIIPGPLKAMSTGILDLLGIEKSFSSDPDKRAVQVYDDLKKTLEEIDALPTSKMCFVQRYLYLPELSKDHHHIFIEEKAGNTYLSLRKQTLVGEPDEVTDPGYQYEVIREEPLTIDYQFEILAYDNEEKTYTVHEIDNAYDPAKELEGIILWKNDFYLKNKGQTGFYSSYPYAEIIFDKYERGSYTIASSYYISSPFPTFYKLPDYPEYVFLDPTGSRYTPSKTVVPISGIETC